MPEINAEGYLVDFNNWSQAFAEGQAEQLEIDLSEDHWKVIHAAREFYENTGHRLTTRLLVRIVRQEVDESLGTSIKLATLFGSQTSRHVALIGGLPKPSDCI